MAVQVNNQAPAFKLSGVVGKEFRKVRLTDYKLFSTETTIDLYNDVVRPKTEWPTRNNSIKTLASYLGFKWRDSHPSGAASVEWYHRWVETVDIEIRHRILDYNEDDCVATRVLLDSIKGLSLA